MGNWVPLIPLKKSEAGRSLEGLGKGEEMMDFKFLIWGFEKEGLAGQKVRG